MQALLFLLQVLVDIFLPFVVATAFEADEGRLLAIASAGQILLDGQLDHHRVDLLWKLL
jgi:hypothetical protein